MNSRRASLSIAEIGLAFLGLSGLLAFNWWLATAPVDTTTTSIESSGLHAPRPASRTPIQNERSNELGNIDVSAIVTHPVFSPTRRPPKQPVKKAMPRPVSQTAAPTMPPPRLMAIAISGDRRSALIAGPQVPGGIWLKEGMGSQGWTIHSIAPDHAVVQSGKQTVTLQLYEASRTSAVR